jgi:HEAT repeat protein
LGRETKLLSEPGDKSAYLSAEGSRPQLNSANPRSEPASGGVAGAISNSSVSTQDAPEYKQRQRQASEPLLDECYPREVLRNLGSSDSDVRAAAARTLGTTGNRLTTAHLIAVLFDEDPKVRRAAAEALIQLDDPDVAISPLKTLLDTGCERPMSQEGETDPRSESQEDAALFEARERTEDGRPREEEPDTYAQDLPDCAQALVAVDGSLRELSPHTIADLQSADPGKRAAALFEVAHAGGSQGFSVITSRFDDPSPIVRNAAALALSELEPTRAAHLFSQALETASPERCRNIGDAMIGSGLAAAAINDLGSRDRERAYDALCMLFVMAKVSAVQPLIQAIEEHESIRVRSAAVRLLSLCGQSDVAETAVKRRLRI